ncbi:MAG TPA: fibronectin type III domain-containing protein [Blastocatellia bacterium]|nr:fibronectin type III domain-containing protein [Blastocatellia bacterium]
MNRFFFRYWRYLLALICGCIVIITSMSCATSSRNSGSPLLIITSIASSNILDVGATITWNTNRLADSQIEYGVNTGYGNVVSLKTLDTSHRMNLFGLTPNTLYHYRVKSKDDGGNLSTSGDLTFTTAKSGTPAPTPSPTPPPAPTPPPSPGAPELPRSFLDTDYRVPTGQTIPVNVGGDLQSALNQAQPGDVILLQAGATFTSNFVLPNKTGAGWVTVRASTSDANLPPGIRVTPASASSMPKIISPNSEPAAQTASGAHHFRFVGIEFGVAPGTNIYNIVAFDANQTSLAQTPHDLIIDRCYIHGNAGDNARRGVMINSASTAIIDSYISNIHEVGADSQAIAGWNGPGPFKIVNNYLEAAGENFMLGGADPSIRNLVQSDIEFRNNHCFKPLSWKPNDPSYAGIYWTVKNLFELKNAQRVLVDGNVFENNWSQSQDGMAILFTPRNQNGGAPWSVVQDVTFTNNIVRHSGGGFNISGPDTEAGPSLPSQRILIKNNVIDDINGQRWTGVAEPADGEFLQIVGGPINITVDHNTVFQSGSIITADYAPSAGFSFLNNIAPHNLYGVIGSSHGSGNDTITHYFPGGVFRKNVIVGVPQGIIYPADNFPTLLLSLVGFVNLAGGDYRLSPISPYKNAGTDGKDVGCDIDALRSKIN